MKPFRDETELVAALRELRPTPRPEFAAELDTRAAAGFPRDSRWESALARLRERLASHPASPPDRPRGRRRRRRGRDRHRGGRDHRHRATRPPPNGPSRRSSRGARRPGSPTTRSQSRLGGGQAQEATPMLEQGRGGWLGRDRLRRGIPDQRARRPRATPRPCPPTPAPTPPRPAAARSSARPRSCSAPTRPRSAPTPPRSSTPSTPPTASSSAPRSATARRARRAADFELLIPSAKLGDALASFSAIAEVRSRHEATQDITAPTVGVGERLQDARATVESLLGQLADADTDAERVAVEAQLRIGALPGRRAALAPLLAGAARQLLAGLAANRDRRRARRATRTAAAGASATASTTPAASSPWPPASP